MPRKVYENVAELVKYIRQIQLDALGSAPDEAAEIYRQNWIKALDEGANNKKLCDNLAGVLVAADGDDLVAIVETIIKQRDEALEKLKASNDKLSV